MRFLSHLTFALLLGGSYTAFADVLYSVTDLGTLGGYVTTVTGINNAGQIIGDFYSPGGVRAFLYTNGRLSDLGTLGGSSAYAYAINNTGQITGSLVTSSGTQAFIYSNGQMTNLGTPSLAYSYARGINDGGQVVGTAIPAPGSAYAFLYTEGQLRNLGTLGGNVSYAYAINNAGQVVGDTQIAPGSAVDHAFLYSHGQMTDLGTLGGSNDNHSEAYAINNAGQITGFSGNSSGASRAFLYSNGQMTDLGTLPGFRYSWGEEINSEGQVAGYLSGARDYLNHHAFFDSNGVMVDLNNLIDPNLQTTLSDAAGINDLGQIVANGSNGHAYLLTPVPEPGTLALLGLALLGWEPGRRWQSGKNRQQVTLYLSSPNTATLFVVPTNTRPFATVGTTNLLPGPNWSRPFGA